MRPRRFTSSFITNPKAIANPEPSLNNSFFSRTRSPPKQCRICQEEKEGWIFGNFISPCKCTGKNAYVHEECLKKWIATHVSNLTNCKCSKCGFKYKMLYNSKRSVKTSLVRFLPRYLILLFVTLIVFWITSFVWFLLILINLVKEDFLFAQTASETMKIVKITVVCLLLMMILLCSYTIHTFLKEKCSLVEISEWEIFDSSMKKKEILFGRRQHKSHSLVQLRRVTRVMSQTVPKNSNDSNSAIGMIYSYNGRKSITEQNRRIPTLSNFKSLGMSGYHTSKQNSISSFQGGNFTVGNSPKIIADPSMQHQLSMEVSFKVNEEDETLKRPSDEQIAEGNVKPSSREQDDADKGSVIRMTIHLDKL